MEATLKSPSPAPKKAVPKANPVPDWKLWKKTFLDGGVQVRDRWGGIYISYNLKVSLDTPHNYNICACCGAPWLTAEAKVRGAYEINGDRKAAVPFDQMYPKEYWTDRQGIYFGEFQDVATLRKNMGMEDEEVFKSFEVRDGETTHALVWKEKV